MANLRVDKITSTETFETTGSVQFDGTNDGLTVSDHADFDLGTGDFTIEGWYYLENFNTSYQCLMDWRGGDGISGACPVVFRNNTGDYIYYYLDGARRIDNIAISYDTWFHLTICRSSSITRLFIDGVERGSFSDSFDYVSSDILLGLAQSNASDIKGHISNYRVVKGKALYTSNFKPPMRELENIPGTVLLCCQSKTDTTLEKTSKTITVRGGAVASELTPGILTPVPKAGGGSAITGSVEFTGNESYLTIPPSSDFTFDSDFTVEAWVFPSSKIAGGNNAIYSNNMSGEWNDNGDGFHIDTNRVELTGNGSVNYPSNLDSDAWTHIALVRSGSNVVVYKNGVTILNLTNSNTFGNGSNKPGIGLLDSNAGTPRQFFAGNISNLRVVKGTALYTKDFIPPTRELKKVPGTVLLACQDSNNPTQEATGKTISLNGIFDNNDVVSSGISTTPVSSNFTPQVGDDRKVTFEGVTKINSDAYFYLPTGDTVTRDSRSGYGNRGLFSLGAAPTAVNTIEFVNIASTGDSQDFGDLTYTLDGSNAGNSSSTRGIFGGGRSSSANVNTINYVTIASTGDAKDFGDLTQIRRGITGHSSSIRGIFAAGRADPGPNPTDTIDFITIASTGNALDFGNLITARRYSGSTSSSTRGLVAGGADPGKLNSIEYITIPSTGNALDFGDLNNNIDQTEGNSNGVRGIFGGGGSHPNYYDNIDYVTIASTGNAKDFGDLLYTRVDSASASNCIRGLFAGGHNPTKFNDIQYVNISSMGNAFDFGSLSTTSAEGSGCSDSHGGLG